MDVRLRPCTTKVERRTWRQRAASIIVGVEAECRQRGATLAEFDRAIRDAWPGGERCNWPYVAWCKERRAALDRYAGKPDAKPVEQLPVEGGLFA